MTAIERFNTESKIEGPFKFMQGNFKLENYIEEISQNFQIQKIL